MAEVLLTYSSKQLDTLFEAAKVFIPVCTGYILLASGSLKVFREQRLLYRPSTRFLLVAVFVCAIAAVGLWSGVIAFLVDCSYAFGRINDLPPALNTIRLDYEWSIAAHCAQAAHVFFFTSVALFCTILMLLVTKLEK